ncbi:ankyrin-3-like [Artemia franciscana]|uniref:PRANC domain-containing protein n=1 Tax=Artemia franciscana TaxID=6661 RepID=A0AA88HF34_ARTSF|nr:hypothetical protein QYM36_013739 [Artemia franciscana]KAK2710169.1 hypothetical protein QYM36_013739 [Artemia franciscana]
MKPGDNNPLIFAVINGDIEGLKMIINQGAEIDSKDDFGKTPLHYAIENVEKPIDDRAEAKNTIMTEIVRMLLDIGARVDATTRFGKTPLHCATENESITMTKIVNMLLDNGAGIDAISRNGETPLHCAIKSKNIIITELLLRHGANVNAKDNDDLSLLHVAVSTGCLQIVKTILENDARVDAKNRNGETPLHCALKTENESITMTKIVNMLLDNGTAIDVIDRHGAIPLHYAIENKNITVTELLLRHGANVNARDNNDLSLLHVAVWTGCLQIVDHLLNCGADINAQDKTGRKPIFYSIWNGDLKMTQLLLTRKPDIKDNPHLLNIACQKGCMEIVQALLEHDADINASDSNGLTALHFTALSDFFNDFELPEDGLYNCLKIDPKIEPTVVRCFTLSHYPNEYVFHLTSYKTLTNMVDVFLKHNIKAIHMPSICNPDPNLQFIKGEIAKLLLRNGGNVDAQDINGVTTLHNAIKNEYAKVVEALLEHSPNVNLETKINIAPLHLSAIKGIRELSAIVLGKGADINAKQKDGITALHIASANGHIEVVKLLLECGAEVDSKIEFDNEQCQMSEPLYFEPSDVKLLLYKGFWNFAEVSDITSLHLAARIGSKEICKLLLSNGANVNAKKKDGTTALHIAIRYANVDVVKLLLECGAEVDSQTKNGITPIHLAAQRGDEKVIEILLKFGANINSIDMYGRGVLHFACIRVCDNDMYCEVGCLMVCTMLLNKGANVNAKQKDGTTPLHIAIQSYHITVTELLLESGANVDSKIENGTTALHIAAELGRISSEIIRFLLEFGADINSVDDVGKTALHIACDYTWGGEYVGKEAIPGLVVHIVKLKAASLFVSDQNLFYYNQCFRLHQTTLLLPTTRSTIRSPSWCVRWQEFRDFQDDCEHEIASMKCEKIIHAKLTFYDILVRSQSSLAIHMRNENLVQVLESMDIADKFPVYASMIKNNFREAMERKELLEQESRILYFLFTEATGLPLECSEKILSYLKNEDFRMLIVAFQPLTIRNPNEKEFCRSPKKFCRVH